MRNLINSIKDARVLTIDPATHSLAFAIMTKDRGINTLIHSGKINLGKGNSQSEKFKIINASIPLLITEHRVTHVIIEQTIYISNPQTSRLLSYIVGGIWARAVQAGCITYDVPPLKWKPGIGYKNVGRKEKAGWIKEFGDKEAKKMADHEKKERVRQIVIKELPGFDTEDSDIMDAVGIGLWALKNGSL